MSDESKYYCRSCGESADEVATYDGNGNRIYYKVGLDARERALVRAAIRQYEADKATTNFEKNRSRIPAIVQEQGDAEREYRLALRAVIAARAGQEQANV